MCALRAGSRSFSCQLQLVNCCCFRDVAKAPAKLVFDCMPVGIVGSDGFIALAVAPVSLAADGMLPSRTPLSSLSFRSCRSLLVGFSHCPLHSVLFLWAWLAGREKCTRFLCLCAFCLQPWGLRLVQTFVCADGGFALYPTLKFGTLVRLPCCCCCCCC